MKLISVLLLEQELWMSRKQPGSLRGKNKQMSKRKCVIRESRALCAVLL